MFTAPIGYKTIFVVLQDSGLGDSPNKEIQILIPQPFMGTIIGTGGTKIKELRSVRI